MPERYGDQSAILADGQCVTCKDFKLGGSKSIVEEAANDHERIAPELDKILGRNGGEPHKTVIVYTDKYHPVTPELAQQLQQEGFDIRGILITE